MSSQSILVQLKNCSNLINSPNYQDLVKLPKTDPYGSYRIHAMNGIPWTDTMDCIDGILYRRYTGFVLKVSGSFEKIDLFKNYCYKTLKSVNVHPLSVDTLLPAAFPRLEGSLVRGFRKVLEAKCYRPVPSTAPM